MAKVLNTLSQYGTGFQVKVLSSLIKQKQFVQNIHDVIDKEYFDSPAHRWLVDEVLRYYYKYHTNPTPESLLVEVRKIENETLKIAVVEQLKEALKISNEDKEYVESEFSSFCKNQHLKKALLQSVNLLQQGDYDSIRVTIDGALKAGQEKNLGHEYEKDLESRFREEDRAPIPTKWQTINELLMGGLGKGDLGLIFAGPGSGKSWVLANIGAAAVEAGFNVNHYTLELSESYVGKRYDSIFTGINAKEVHLHRKEVETAISKLKGSLIVKEFPMGKATVHMLESHIQKCADLGKPPHLILIDYLDLMKSSSRRNEIKDEIDDVYTSVKGLARQLGVPIWSPSQVNRSGSGDSVIEGDKAAGSYNKIMIADFIISLSRKRTDKQNKTARIHIMKNRYGADGMTYGVSMNTDNGSIIIDPEELTEEQIKAMDTNLGEQSFQKISKFSSAEAAHLVDKFFHLSTNQTK